MFRDTPYLTVGGTRGIVGMFGVGGIAIATRYEFEGLRLAFVGKVLKMLTAL